MPCPWYKNGMCTSPKLVKPSTLVVNPERCQGGRAEYESCRFYAEPTGDEGGKGARQLEGLERFQRREPQTAVAEKFKPYPPIHVLPSRVESSCPYYKLYDYGSGYLAYCDVLTRLLTRSEAQLCAQLWRNCPLYRMSRSGWE